MKTSKAEVIREYGPFPEAEQVHGVSFDGKHVWFASGNRLNTFDPESGKKLRSLDVAGHAGTAFDGEHLFQIAENRIQKIDPKTGRVLSSIPAPGGGGDSGSPGPKARCGSASTGSGRSISSIPKPARCCAQSSPTVSSPASPGSMASCGTAPGKATRAICGVSIRERERCWSRSRCRAASPYQDSKSDGSDQFFCGGGSSGKVRAVRRPNRGSRVA